MITYHETFVCGIVLMVLTAFLSAQTTINRSDIPVATHFYMPIGDRYSDIQNDFR